MDQKPKASKRGRPKGSRDRAPRKIAKDVVRKRKPKVVDPDVQIKTVQSHIAAVPAWIQGRNLPPKHAVFVAEYLEDMDGVMACLRMGYKDHKAAKQASQAYMKRPGVMEAIQSAVQARAVRTAVTGDRIIEELARIAFTSPTAVMSWGPEGIILKDSMGLKENELALVAEVSETKPTEKGGGSLKVKLHDKMKALELLMRNLGMLTDNMTLRAQVQDAGKADAEDKEVLKDVLTRARERWQQGQGNARSSD